MKKYQTMSVKEFMNREYEIKKPIQKVEEHFRKYKVVYRVVGSTIILFMIGDGSHLASAAFTNGYTDGIIDKEASVIYKDLADIGKWLIIGRGGWEIIHSVLKQDVDGAKKNFIGYVLAYALLLAFPHIMDKVDGIFDRFGA